MAKKNANTNPHFLIVENFIIFALLFIKKMENKKVKDAIRVIISLGLGILIFYLVYRQIDINEVKANLKTAHWGYLIFPIIICFLSTWFRAARWNMFIEPVAKVPASKNTFCAVMIGYFVNHLIPRGGEIARCAVLTKYEGIPMSELVGTVITERAFDLIVTLGIVFITVLFEHDIFAGVLGDVNILDSLTHFITNPYLWGALIIITLFIVFFKKKLAHFKFAQKFKGIGVGIWNGLKSFTKIKNKPLFILYTFLIFFMYYLMLYTTFWIFDFSKDLSLGQGLVTYVFGSLGMIVPTQGGIGAYEYMTIQALLMYGITKAQAGTFAVIAHVIEIIIYCVCGFLCTLILPVMNRNNNSTNNSESTPSNE